MQPTTYKYHIWNRRWDLSEINHFNSRVLLKKYFEITTKKIALLAMLLVLNIICAVISQFALGLARIGGFLTISITFWTIIVCYIAMGGFYAIIFLEITVWFRAALGNDVAQLVALNISDFTFLFALMVIVFVINKIRFLFKQPESKKWSYFIVLCIGMLLATFITSGLDTGYNKWFLIDFYYKTAGVDPIAITKGLLITIFWFNLVQYAINCALFIAVYNVSYTLINRYF